MTRPPFVIAPVVLEGLHVRLEPLALDHVPALAEVALDAAIWRYMPYAVRSPADVRTWVTQALDEQGAGRELPFATVDRVTGQVAGSTRFLAVDAAHRRVEIGGTWLAPAWQRTAVNTEAKYLMLSHAFETLGCVRVELKTDALNLRSRAAILRLGAREEGTLRQHMIMPDGRLRDSVYYSIIHSEWPAIETRLRDTMRREATRSQPAPPPLVG